MSQYKYYVVTFFEYEGWLDLKENDGIVQNTQVIQYVADES